jgi:hypothetical protein
VDEKLEFTSKSLFIQAKTLNGTVPAFLPLSISVKLPEKVKEKVVVNVTELSSIINKPPFFEKELENHEIFITKETSLQTNITMPTFTDLEGSPVIMTIECSQIGELRYN